MTTFEDGPAAGAVLSLRRAPLLLRVVHDAAANQFDALDQLGDTPRPGEKLYVYRRADKAGSVHIDGCDRRGRRFGQWYAVATYRLHANQPDDATMRDTTAWRQWAQAEAARGNHDAPAQ